MALLGAVDADGDLAGLASSDSGVCQEARKRIQAELAWQGFARSCARPCEVSGACHKACGASAEAGRVYGEGDAHLAPRA